MSKMKHSPGRWLRDSSGFTGAQRALLCTVALALILSGYHLVSGGSGRAASDGQRALRDNPLVSGKLDTGVGPVHAAAMVDRPLSPIRRPGLPQPAAEPTLAGDLRSGDATMNLRDTYVVEAGRPSFPRVGP